MPETQEKIESLSQVERVLFGIYCKLVNQVLYPEESREKKPKVQDLDRLFQSLSDTADVINIFRVIDVVMDATAELLSEEKLGNAKDIEADLKISKVDYFSKYLWQFDTVGFATTTAQAFYSDLENLLREKVAGN